MTRIAPFDLNRDDLLAITPLWQGERCDDGRPRVDDEVIRRLETIALSDAWYVLAEHGMRHQYEGGWQRIDPRSSLCGRALTAMFLPLRRDLGDAIASRAAAAGVVGGFTSWPIESLQPGDVYVADVFGKIEWGPVAGDNLCTAIQVRTQRGIVVNGAVRDVEGIERIAEFPVFARGFHPSYATPATTLVGINCPVRLGSVTVLPGDVIVGKGDGLLVVPPHLAASVATRCEVIALRDEFAKERLRARVYTPGQIDGRWTDEIEADFRAWISVYRGSLPVPPQAFERAAGAGRDTRAHPACGRIAVLAIAPRRALRASRARHRARCLSGR
jgi:4-hydroxy-4-methyl-2-oxoglutarate aldolase